MNAENVLKHPVATTLDKLEERLAAAESCAIETGKLATELARRIEILADQVAALEMGNPRPSGAPAPLEREAGPTSPPPLPECAALDDGDERERISAFPFMVIKTVAGEPAEYELLAPTIDIAEELAHKALEKHRERDGRPIEIKIIERTAEGRPIAVTTRRAQCIAPRDHARLNRCALASIS